MAPHNFREFYRDARGDLVISFSRSRYQYCFVGWSVANDVSACCRALILSPKAASDCLAASLGLTLLLVRDASAALSR
jgi:hypothetical protein